MFFLLKKLIYIYWYCSSVFLALTKSAKSSFSSLHTFLYNIFSSATFIKDLNIITCKVNVRQVYIYRIGHNINSKFKKKSVNIIRGINSNTAQIFQLIIDTFQQQVMYSKSQSFTA